MPLELRSTFIMFPTAAVFAILLVSVCANEDPQVLPKMQLTWSQEGKTGRQIIKTEGETFTRIAGAEGSILLSCLHPTPGQVKYFLNGSEITFGFVVRTDRLLSEKHQLLNHSGDLECGFPDGEKSGKIHLQFLEPMDLGQTNQTIVTKMPAAPFHLDSGIQGENLTISWSKDGFVVGNERLLEFSSVNLTSAGHYQVTATQTDDVQQVMKTKDIFLVVQHQPFFETGTIHKKPQVEETFVCDDAIAEPPINQGFFAEDALCSKRIEKNDHFDTTGKVTWTPSTEEDFQHLKAVYCCVHNGIGEFGVKKFDFDDVVPTVHPTGDVIPVTAHHLGPDASSSSVTGSLAMTVLIGVLLNVF